MELPCPLHPGAPNNNGGDVSRDAAAYLAAGAVGPRPQPTAEAAVRLLFPWGPAIVPTDGLIVGRDHGQSCGTQIDGYDNVSRRHARISLEAGSVFVEDLDSTNGTTVNGAHIAPRHRTAVALGDILGFGNRLQVTVTAGEQP
ncbi:Forkhead-associated protein [Mycolicibacterium rhodesiae JS60]|nr:Forkhead-associated protein [Mycolicibacterium rhodesiae JS60]